MSAPAGHEADWGEFIDTIAEVVPEPSTELAPETRPIEDLGLDSLALIELLVVLIEKYDPAGLAGPLDDRTWEGVTLGILFRECTGSGRGGGSTTRFNRTA